MENKNKTNGPVNTQYSRQTICTMFFLNSNSDIGIKDKFRQTSI